MCKDNYKNNRNQSPAATATQGNNRPLRNTRRWPPAKGRPASPARAPRRRSCHATGRSCELFREKPFVCSWNVPYQLQTKQGACRIRECWNPAHAPQHRAHRVPDATGPQGEWSPAPRNIPSSRERGKVGMRAAAPQPHYDTAPLRLVISPRYPLAMNGESRAHWVRSHRVAGTVPNRRTFPPATDTNCFPDRACIFVAVDTLNSYELIAENNSAHGTRGYVEARKNRPMAGCKERAAHGPCSAPP